MDKIYYDEILRRMGYFLNLANKSGRSVSLDMEHGELYLNRILNKNVELKMSTFLEFCDILNITPQDFFYLGDKFNANDKNILEKFSKLTDENKRIVLDLMEKLK